MTRVLAIDPGSAQSAWLLYAHGEVEGFAIQPNEELLASLRLEWVPAIDVVVIEQIESYGMAVGREVFDTVWWAGQFAEAVYPLLVLRMPRRTVKLALCQDSRAKDANIRAALIDRFGGPESRRKGGPLYGVSKDVWSALAIAVTFVEAAA